jgi:hypothetical protein
MQNVGAIFFVVKKYKTRQKANFYTRRGLGATTPPLFDTLNSPPKSVLVCPSSILPLFFLLKAIR